ncbi:hypothetical protein [Enterococcus faecium]|uniref:hypothetical protein n=1 Tax=Enterococcus faecium TaxID=1352 RepID=UPI0023B2C193|nr:hypothetical protein [Enterococcus faecium]
MTEMVSFKKYRLISVEATSGTPFKEEVVSLPFSFESQGAISKKQLLMFVEYYDL